jgi:WD40 repeat protein
MITPRNLARLKPIVRLKKEGVYMIAPGGNLDTLAFTDWFKPVEIRAVDGLRLIETLLEGKQVLHIAFSPQPGVVAYSENDESRTVKILDRRAGRTLTLDSGGLQSRMAFNPDGSVLATGGEREVRLWRATDGALLRVLDCGPVDGALSPRFSPDGRLIVVGHRNSTTRLFEAATGRLLIILPKEMT